MTAAPLPAPLPACPFCGADGEDLRVLPPTCTPKSPYNPADRAYPVLRCGGCGASVPGEDWDTLGASAVAAWNRRAPEAQAWRAESQRIERRVYKGAGEYRDYLHARFADRGLSQVFAWQDHNWRYEVTAFDDEGEYDLIWRPAPPDATPAAPPAREAALAEALRESAKLLGDMIFWAESQCPLTPEDEVKETPRCSLCGIDPRTDACRALPHAFPPTLVDRLRVVHRAALAEAEGRAL